MASDNLRGARPHFAITSAPVVQNLTIGTTVTMVIQFNPHGFRGRFQDRMELKFIDTSTGEEFAITRRLAAAVGIQADLDLLRPIAPYTRPVRPTLDPEGDVVPGEKPPALTAIPWKIKLEQYPIPAAISSALARREESDQIEQIRALLPQNLDARSHGKHFASLLHVEEDRMKKDLRIYNMTGVTLTSHGSGGSIYY
ncbi:hypothetical protein FRC03_008116 [Tulasnella sp. 419]|nr:hypothetical protein FRC03_008116 [Tulasnella sp. 419]